MGKLCVSFDVWTDLYFPDPLHHQKDTVNFFRNLHVLVSFDVVPLFTISPVSELLEYNQELFPAEITTLLRQYWQLHARGTVYSVKKLMASP